MTTEREEALELAREVGLETRTLNSIDPDEIVVDQVIITDEIERLVRLAKQRGAEESGEACATMLELSNSDLLLMAGEMTKQELRTVKAVLTQRAAAMRRRYKPIIKKAEEML